MFMRLLNMITVILGAAGTVLHVVAVALLGLSNNYSSQTAKLLSTIGMWATIGALTSLMLYFFVKKRRG